MTKATQEGRVRFGFTVAEGQESFTITEQKPGTKHQAWWQRQQLKTHTENHKQETERAALENSKPTAVTTSSSKATPPQPWQAGRPTGDQTFKTLRLWWTSHSKHYTWWIRNIRWCFMKSWGEIYRQEGKPHPLLLLESTLLMWKIFLCFSMRQQSGKLSWKKSRNTENVQIFYWCTAMVCT